MSVVFPVWIQYSCIKFRTNSEISRKVPKYRGLVSNFVRNAAAEGQVALHEREVLAGEIGQPLSQIRTGLGLRIYRDEHSIGFWEAAAQRLDGARAADAYGLSAPLFRPCAPGA